MQLAISSQQSCYFTLLIKATAFHQFDKLHEHQIGDAAVALLYDIEKWCQS